MAVARAVFWAGLRAYHGSPLAGVAARQPPSALSLPSGRAVKEEAIGLPSTVI